MLPVRTVIDSPLGQDERVRTVMRLPDFPLTGTFRPAAKGLPPAQAHDLELLYDETTGHARLREAVDPNVLYGGEYAYRSSASHAADAAAQFLLNVIDNVCRDHRPECVLEVGCNDMVLLHRLAERAGRAIGIDPLWASEKPESIRDIDIVGGYVEDLELGRTLPAKPDLIVSNHNLEHIADPLATIKRLAAAATPDAVFVVAVPDFSIMVANGRFDQVFHQHIHYFGLSSMLRLIEAAGLHYLNHCHDRRHWGGTLVVAFTRQPTGAAVPVAPTPLAATAVAEAVNRFQWHLDGLRGDMERLAMPIWGYGAGNMVPALAYHIDGDLGCLAGLLDDNPDRHGMGYPGLKPVIGPPGPPQAYADSAIFVTSPDAARPILKRIADLNPARIILPSPHL
jgi:SAM-dependent methyltransferase